MSFRKIRQKLSKIKKWLVVHCWNHFAVSLRHW